MGSYWFVILFVVVFLVALAWIARSRGHQRKPENDAPRGSLGTAYKPDDERPGSHPR